MSWYLLEFLTEEIPARMQKGAVHSLGILFKDKLTLAGVPFSTLESFVTPRRLGIFIDGLPTHQADRIEEKKGPSITATPQAIEGFLKGSGVTLEQCETREIPGKGTFYFVVKTLSGGLTKDIIVKIVSEIIQEFPWAKSMHWGSYAMTWVRPLRSVISLFDEIVLPVGVEDPHITVGNTTYGHRFLSGESFSVKGFEDYKEKLRAHYVILDRQERAEKILGNMQVLCASKNLQLKEDPDLLEEVLGLVEWPVVLMGQIDAQFMSLPPEVLETTMRTHQKYFSVLTKDGTTAPYFLIISNIESIDRGAQIIEGNERVLRARLSDAAFFWTQDQKIPLKDRLPLLDSLIFHERIGSVGDKSERMKRLAPFCLERREDVSSEFLEQAALLAKTDLITGVVGEFPELQGIMGSYYAAQEGYDPAVSKAIKEHYAPLGPSDHVPESPLSVAVALADKIDTLVAFWSVGIHPTGSKDPYALRRTALGILRLLLENKLSFDLRGLFEEAYKNVNSSHKIPRSNIESLWKELRDFLIGRLKALFREQGFNFSLVEAAFSNERNEAYLNVYKSYIILQALSHFVSQKEGQDFLGAHKRVYNILKQADLLKKELPIDEDLLKKEGQEEEKILYSTFQHISAENSKIDFDQASEKYYEKILENLSSLRHPLDDFFDKVTVQAEDSRLRLNRLALLQKVHRSMEEIADFSQISPVL